MLNLGSKKVSAVEMLYIGFEKIVDKFIEGGDTANICALDLTKAFDKVNHASLYMKLMKRHTVTTVAVTRELAI